MPTKITMNSGKEFIIAENAEYIISSFFNENKLPMGGTTRVLKNTFLCLDDNRDIFINPSHVSSVETVD
ncbi:hypothetical protein D1B33_09730 [Lysinibacillus yapensis]|uniref:Uncharacterized protein n=1 Tax=Ureibacillus yapensis TaxID=2304605 RepID=A0A396SEM1_9BACL|nr:hypothetical protein [Lysinibacillus yapensis]RHW36672.1 hypothetical protein D1B33_09730 [Lysinibacillus yapensis]